jgi:NitT/TauT family transport system permease protein
MSVSSEGVKTAESTESRPAEVALPTQRDGVPHLRYATAGLVSVISGLVLWELISRLAIDNALFLAAPSQIAVALYNLGVTGQLWHHIAISGVEFVLGYGIACVLGILLGLAMASSEIVKQACQPWVAAFNSIPSVALAPLFILWLGIGIWSKVLVIIFLVLFPVTISTEAGLRTTSDRLIEMLRSFGATPQQIFFKVSLPSAFPSILAGLRIGIGRALIGVVVAEFFGSRAGLGRLISQSSDAFNMPELFAGVVVLAAAGIVMTAGFDWLERRLVPWTKD